MGSFCPHLLLSAQARSGIDKGKKKTSERMFRNESDKRTKQAENKKDRETNITRRKFSKIRPTVMTFFLEKKMKEALIISG